MRVLFLLVLLGGWVVAQQPEDRLRRAPAFDLAGESGHRLGLDDLRGKLVLLVFFKPG